MNLVNLWSMGILSFTRRNTLLIVLNPVAGLALIKCAVWSNVYTSMYLNCKYLLNTFLNANKSVGNVSSCLRTFFNYLIFSLSLYSTDSSFSNEYRYLGRMYNSFSAAAFLFSFNSLNALFLAWTERNYDGIEFGKMINQAGNINSNPGIIMKNEKGINFKKSL